MAPISSLGAIVRESQRLSLGQMSQRATCGRLTLAVYTYQLRLENCLCRLLPTRRVHERASHDLQIENRMHERSSRGSHGQSVIDLPAAQLASQRSPRQLGPDTRVLLVRRKMMPLFHFFLSGHLAARIAGTQLRKLRPKRHLKGSATSWTLETTRSSAPCDAGVADSRFSCVANLHICPYT